jgi:hypothetical protein
MPLRFRRLPPCLQAGAGRHRVQAEGLALPLRSLAGLAQDEEPGTSAVGLVRMPKFTS